VGDGCGGVLQCGTCSGGKTCGGGGTPSVCGAGTTCTPKTCMQIGANCGPVADGCGGVLHCGSCQDPDTCGGGGSPSICGQALDEINCCFPGALAYNVRAGKQWVAVGDQSGFLHSVVADAATGVCRNSCDPVFARKNARVRESPSLATTNNAPIQDDPKPPAFELLNPMFRFAITQASTKDAQMNVKSVESQRDMQFRFSTLDAFAPLLVPLTNDATALIQPNAITYLPSTGEVVITDGGYNGIIFVSLDSSTVTRSYF
jgi:hypothetical protein